MNAIRLVCFLALAVCSPAFAGDGWRPIWPAIERYELAELARSRPLTAAEVALVSENWLTTTVYLQAALQASLLHGQGSSYLELPQRPSDLCLNTALHDFLALARDGTLTDADLGHLWEENGGLAWFAYMIATDGQESSDLFNRAALAGFNAAALRTNLVARYYALRTQAPSVPTQHVEHILKLTVLRSDVGAARLIELGASARDVLWQRIQDLPPQPTQADVVAVTKRASLLSQAIKVLGAVNDQRIHGLSEAESPFIAIDTQRYLASLRARPPGVRDIRYERAVLFWRALCVEQPQYRRTAPAGQTSP